MAASNALIYMLQLLTDLPTALYTLCLLHTNHIILIIAGSGSGGQDVQLPPTRRVAVQVNCSTLQCQEGFSCSALGNTSLCLPVCGRWEQYPHSAVVAIDVAIIVSASIGLVASIAVLVISCIRWKHM